MDGDIRILEPDEVRRIYRSPTKLEILDKIQSERILSMRHLARRLGRDKTNVRDNLRDLEDMDIIELKNDSFRGAGCKVPILKNDRIIAEPLELMTVYTHKALKDLYFEYKKDKEEFELDDEQRRAVIDYINLIEEFEDKRFWDGADTQDENAKMFAKRLLDEQDLTGDADEPGTVI